MLPEDGGPSPQQPLPKLQNYVLEHVLKGEFPAATIKRMNKNRLERLVTQLIQRTTNDGGAPPKNNTTKSKKQQQQQHSLDTNNINSATSNNNKAVVTLKKPKWWPSDVTFNHTLSLSGSENNNHDVRVLKQLVADCSQFFKTHKVRKWPQPEADRQHRSEFWEENDENARRTTLNNNNNKLKLKPTSSSGSEKPVTVKQKLKQPAVPSKHFKAFVEIRPSSVEPFDDCPQVPPPPSPSLEPLPTLDQNQFMTYFKLSGNNNTLESTNNKCAYDNNNTSSSSALAPCYNGHPMKLTNTFNIPFSSDVGRIMALRENHFMPEDLKLRRLERSEWYTNKIAADKDKVPSQNPGADLDFGIASNFKEPPYTRTYKPPKRQYHQKSWSLHNVKFLAKFCIPVSVRLERQDLSKLVVTRAESSAVKMDDRKTVLVNLEQMDLSKYNKSLCRRSEAANVKVVLQRMHLNKKLISSGSKKLVRPNSVVKSSAKAIGNVQKTRKKIKNPPVDFVKGGKDKTSLVRTSPRLKCGV